MSYFDSWGLLGSRDNDPNSFNSILYTVQYYLLIRQLPGHAGVEGMTEQKVLANLHKVLSEDLDMGHGIVKNIPSEPDVLTETNLISHDNITAICCADKLISGILRDEILEQFVKQGLRYNNVTPESPGSRFLLPQDALFLTYVNGKVLSYPLFPIYAIAAVISCLNSSTSGKLLYYISCLTMSSNKLFRILFDVLTLVIRLNPRFGSWKDVFDVYYIDPNHPNNVLSRELYK